MARNNEDRFGANTATGASAPPTPVATAGNSAGGLSFATPTEFVELPSKGRFYAKGHPLHGEETLEIRFMTAKEEDILTSKALLKKGLAIDRMLQNLIINPQIKIHELLTGDKNAITIAARISGYGPEYLTKVTCPACTTINDLEFNLGEASVRADEVVEPGVTGPTERGTYIMKLPKLGVDVEIKLFTGEDEKKLLQMAQMKKKNNLPESSLTDQLRLGIVSVNGDSDKATINKLINNMPAFDSRHFRITYLKLMPNVDMKHEFTCELCGYDSEVEVPFTAEFFWPK